MTGDQRSVEMRELCAKVCDEFAQKADESVQLPSVIACGATARLLAEKIRSLPAES